LEEELEILAQSKIKNQKIPFLLASFLDEARHPRGG
jgi:hypothetical protein